MALANQVAVGLALVQVEVVPERDPAVVRLRTKLVIAAHPHGLAAVLAVEDSAAVAETTPARAATEAAAAWAAAVTAAAAAVVVAAVE